jgi:2-amino-4-hydroxy-6-hydroxymethyldihydropteridine diphosphokinase
VRPSTESVLLSLGSNIDPAANLLRAVEVLGASVNVVAASRIFETDPVADRPMPQFLNAALEVLTDLEPGVLKYEVLRWVEVQLGRKRTDYRDAPRQIDVDLALFGDRIISDPDLGIEIPDPEILRHAHVALPLADIAARRLHPLSGRTLGEIAAAFGADCGVRLAPGSDALAKKLDSLPPLR